ncbi:MAG TPA: EAL domain-containing protein, partial [Burkholderiales bacterium]|nr:EAL domain-containing protein [Burkholderiales bacterium]
QYQALLANPAMTGNLRSHYRRKDGSIIPIESTRRVLRSGGRSLIVGISRDVRERLAAEQELRQKDAYFRSLIENVSDAIAATDKTWRFLYVSPSIATLTGYTAEELIGKEFGSTTTLGDIAAVRERLAAALERSGEPQRVRVEMIRKDGELRVHDLVVSKGAGPGGDPIYIIAGRDVTDWIRAEEALRRSAEEFRTLAENAPDGFLRFDDELRCLFANSAILKSSGRSMGALLGRTLREIALPEELRRLWAEAIRRVLATGETQTVEYRYHGSRGEREYQARFAAERGPDGKPATVLVISRDITDRKRAERAIAESEARLRSIVEASAEPLLLVDPDGTMLFANPAAASLFDRPLEKLQGTPLGLPLGHGRPVDVEIMLPGGHVRPVEMQFAPTELNGKPMLVVSLHDLSERKHYEKHIEHLANHDGLTGLPNRTLLRDRVAQVISHARRTNGHVGLMFVDLDHFKLVNDSWGHVAGDMLLLEVARRLQLATRDGDTVARLGGDEFVVLLPDLARPDDIAVVARKLADALEEPIDVDGRSVRVTASIGISTFPGDGDDLESLLQCADAAMYRAKDAGRNGYQYYSAEMSAQARVRVETENGLRQALQQSELRLHFQPQLSFADGKVQGFEALMRWERPSHGMVPPAQFIPVAEESGLIMPMGQWALHTACREAMAWSSAGLGKLKVAVNLSARQFWRGSVTDVVRAALAESGLPPEQLELEITESVVARDLKQVMLSLEHLRRMGITIAIDDFGTGYSSLAYLRSLPIDKLKIDKSFIAGIPVDPEASALVGEIIRLAHVLSLEVVAEGVETAGQAAFLRDAGCEAMQGFFFSRPLAADDCATLLRSARCLQLDPLGP